ncbi:MAG: tetratricopeptide repeat protein [bacterium]|nr:tetratricopeptide repeat protein [bacterium]
MRRPAQWLIVALLGTAFLGSGCASTASPESSRRGLEELIAIRGLDPEQIVFPDRVTDQMRAWVQDRVPHSNDRYRRLVQLLEALEDPGGLNLRYEAGHTGTAEEVFVSGTYNCLSFSHLFLALARELGVDADYMSVDRIRRFRKEGDVVLVSGHVTVGFGIASNRRYLAYNVGPNIDYRTAVPISDITALALFYGNRGAEEIRAGSYREAAEWLETGVQLDPHIAGTWVNLGVARRRTGDLDGAEQAYLRAVEIDSGFFPAYRNLAGLHKLRGREDVAQEMFELLERRGNRNPYAFLALGDQSLEQGRPEEAEAYYRRALNLSTDKSEALVALGLLALEREEIDEAKEWLEKARRANPQSPRVDELASELEPGTERQETPAGGAVRIESL